MIKFITNLFKSNEIDKLASEEIFEDNDRATKFKHCESCSMVDKCKGDEDCQRHLGHMFQKRLSYSYCGRCIFDEELSKIDPNKDTIFIIDDNEGMVSFLEDDIDYLKEEGIIDADKVNTLTLSGSHSAFTFELMLLKNKGLNIKWAIIDITLGGSIMTREGNIKYTGVDVFEMIIKYHPDVNFLFYTGNNLNPYIKANKKIIDQFYNLTKEDINDYVLFKTSMDMDSRREYIAEHLFNYKIEKDSD